MSAGTRGHGDAATRRNGFVPAGERPGMPEIHASFRAAAATAAGYAVILAVMTVLLFAVPFALFSL